MAEMGEDPRLAALAALVGDWTTTITMLEADGTAGAVSRASDIYRWSANGRFVEHHVDAEMDGTRIRSLEVIALDPAGQGYVTRSYDPDGSFSDFTAVLEGRSWQITGEVQRFRGNFSEDGGTLTGQWEQQADGRWSPLMTVTLRRL